MARSKSRSGGSRRGADSRQSSAKSRKPAAPAEVEVVEETGGLTIDDGIPMISTVLLVAAILFVDYALAHQYGAGTFF